MRPQNGLLIFLWKETHSETKSWKSSRISTKKITTATVNPGNRRDFACETNFLHFFIVHHFSSFFDFFIFHFFSFFPFFSFVYFFHFSFVFHFFISFISCIFHFSIFLHFPTFSVFFCSFSIIFFLLLFLFLFLFFLLGAQNLFFLASISLRFLFIC